MKILLDQMNFGVGHTHMNLSLNLIGIVTLCYMILPVGGNLFINFVKSTKAFFKLKSGLPKNIHSLSKCAVCAVEHIQLQKSYPRLPCFENSLIKFPLDNEEATVTRRVWGI